MPDHDPVTDPVIVTADPADPAEQVDRTDSGFAGPGFQALRRPTIVILGAALVAALGGVAALGAWAGAGAGAGPSVGSKPPRPPAHHTIGVLAATTSNVCPTAEPRLTVSGSAQVQATPDLLTMVAEVVITKGDAQSALADDEARSRAVIAGLVADGVAPSDIQTSGLSIQPQYDYPGGVQELTGYQVDESITVTFEGASLARAGVAIDGVAKTAGNGVRIDTLSFSVADPSAALDQARAQAVAQATTAARAMAAASGDRLGPICSLTDQTLSSSTPVPYYFANTTAGAAAPASVPLNAGKQQESAQVQLVYGLIAGGAST